jgi:hypothetical protein
MPGSFCVSITFSKDNTDAEKHHRVLVRRDCRVCDDEADGGLKARGFRKRVARTTSTSRGSRR